MEGKKEDGGVYPLIDPEIAGRIQAVFLSHAHEDHSMALPLLYQYGYQGKIWATRATAQQLPSYFAAWERYARSHGHELPYDQDAAARLEFVFLEEQGTAGEWLEVFPGLKLRWGRSGHLPGSVWLLLNWEGRLIYFSGDYTEESMVLAADRPKLPDGVAAADLAIMDAAYGADPDSQSAKLHRLRQATQSALQQGGSVLYPVPVYGRGQELMLWAYDTFPDARLVIEETLLKPLEQLAVKSEWLHSGTSRRVKALLASGRLHCISSHREREEEIANGESAVIFTADGMMETETAKWYYAQLASSSRNTIILTGHLARGSFGDKLLHQLRDGEDRACTVQGASRNAGCTQYAAAASCQGGRAGSCIPNRHGPADRCVAG